MQSAKHLLSYVEVMETVEFVRAQYVITEETPIESENQAILEVLDYLSLALALDFDFDFLTEFVTKND